MSKNWWSKALSIFMALLLVIVPMNISQAAGKHTGFETVDGNSRYFIDGKLVKSAVSKVDNGLYYSNEKGNITAEVLLDAGMTYKLVEEQKGYFSSYAAMDGELAVSNLHPGNYYIYKMAYGSVNLSNVKDEPGSWVRLEDSQKNMFKQFDGISLEEVTSVKEGATYQVTENTDGYFTADDARNMQNPKSVQTPGQYYIYRIVNGSINISQKAGEPGAWINTSSSSETKTIVEVDTTTKSKKVDEDLKLLEEGKFKLAKNVSGYLNAPNALTGVEPVSNVEPGIYYVFKSFRGALNLSSVKDQPGSWINPNDLGDSEDFVEKQKSKDKAEEPMGKGPKEIAEEKSKVKAYKIGDRYELKKTTNGYFNAENAIKAVNSNSRVRPGTYYVYTFAENNAINITPVKGEAGYWIIDQDAVKETVVEKPVTEKKEEKKPSVASTSEKDKFVLVIDPGHGMGNASNRGGLLFNEGDQNYSFSRLLIKEANKYKGIVVKTTREKIADYPSLESRAKAGIGADLFLSLHTNAAPRSIRNSEKIRGVEVQNSNYSENTSMAYEISKMVSDTLNTPNRGVKYSVYSGGVYGRPVVGAKDYYRVFRDENTAKTKYLIEFAFHTNIDDSVSYLANQDKLAQNLMEIIAKNYGLSK